MDEFRARRVVDALRDRGIDGHLAKVGVSQYGVRVSLPDGRQAQDVAPGAVTQVQIGDDERAHGGAR